MTRQLQAYTTAAACLQSQLPDSTADTKNSLPRPLYILTSEEEEEVISGHVVLQTGEFFQEAFYAAQLDATKRSHWAGRD